MNILTVLFLFSTLIISGCSKSSSKSSEEQLSCSPDYGVTPVESVSFNFSDAEGSESLEVGSMPGSHLRLSWEKYAFYDKSYRQNTFYLIGNSGESSYMFKYNILTGEAAKVSDTSLTVDKDVEHEVVDSKMYFVANNNVDGKQIWAVNLNDDTLTQVTDFFTTSSVKMIGQYNKKVYFRGNDSVDYGVWSLDTTLPSNIPVKVSSSISGKIWGLFNNFIYYVDDESVFRFDISSAQSSLVVDLSSEYSYLTSVASLENGFLVFYALNHDSKSVVGKLRLATSEVSEVKSDYSFLNFSQNKKVLRGRGYIFNGLLYINHNLSGNEDTVGYELYVYNPKLKSMKLVKDLYPGLEEGESRGNSSNPGSFFEHDEKLKFFAYGPNCGHETLKILSIDTSGKLRDDFLNFQHTPGVILGGKIFSRTGESGLSVFDLNSKSFLSNFSVFEGSVNTGNILFVQPVGSKLLLRASINGNPRRLYLYDPASSILTRILDADPLMYFKQNVLLGSNFYFYAEKEGDGFNRYRYSISTETLTKVDDFPSDIYKWRARGEHFVVGDKFFSNVSSKGSGAGATLLFDTLTQTSEKIINSTDGAFIVSTRNFLDFNGKVYFSGQKTTATGTSPYIEFVYDPATGIISEYQEAVFPVVTVYSYINNDTVGYNGKYYFARRDAASGAELWSYDVATDTSAMIADTVPGTDDLNPKYLTLHNGKIYFTGTFGGIGSPITLGVYDPALNTITNLAVNTAVSSSNHITVYNDKIYFSAPVPTHHLHRVTISYDTVSGVTENLGYVMPGQVFDSSLYFHSGSALYRTK